MTKTVNKTTMQCVQTGRVECKKKSIVALCCASFALAGLLTLMTRTTINETWSTPQARAATEIENVAAFESFACALTLLDEGNKTKAQNLLDSVQQEHLVIKSGGTGSGMLRAYSPTTLLMALSKRLVLQATRSARAGNAVEARLWLNYTAQLADQVARSPQPTGDAICLSHYIDMNLARSQVRVAQLLGDARAQAAAEKRCQFLRYTWQTEVLPQLQNTPETAQSAKGNLLVVQDTQAELRRIQNRYGLCRMQAGLSTA